MWKRTYPRVWGRYHERYCDEYLPDKKQEICERAERCYTELLKQMPI
ncbi:MAG: hypothetical protein IJ192_03180 [Clostridia bacterium]|nr:hypothetical protein [Clostridia bacterium]